MMEYGHGGDIYRNRNVELDFSVNVNPLGMPNFVWGGSPEEHYLLYRISGQLLRKPAGTVVRAYRCPGRSDDLRKRGGGIDLPAGTGGTAEKGSDPCAIFRGV